MHWHLQLTEHTPFRPRLERVDRFTGFHLDGAQQLSAPFGKEHQVRIHHQLADGDRLVLLVARIDNHFVLALVARLQQANHSIVLELLADRAGENRAH